MYKKGETIIYPVYGISKINRIYKEMVDGVEKEYYEITFENGLFISVPTDQAEKLGLRYPLSKAELKKAAKNLSKKIRIKEEALSTLADVSKEKLATGKTEDAVELIRMLTSAEKMKQEKNHNLSLTEQTNLTSAVNFVRSEVLSVFGQKGIVSFDLDSFPSED